MQRLTRLLWVWLCAAALPLQGFAAATMQVCGVTPGVQHAVAVTAMHASPSAKAHVGMASHEGMNDSHGQASARLPCHDQPIPGHTGGAQPCSLCAACGGMTPMALPGGTAVCGTIAVADAFAPFTAQAPPAFLTPGIERPPKPATA